MNLRFLNPEEVIFAPGNELFIYFFFLPKQIPALPSLGFHGFSPEQSTLCRQSLPERKISLGRLGL